MTLKKVVTKSKALFRQILLFTIGRLVRIIKKRPLPKPANGKVLIHFGCGDMNDKRFINVDSRPGWHIHYVDTIENCTKLFPGNYADLVYACHIIEHISHLTLTKTLRGLHTILKPEGILRISVPNFDTVVKIYLEKKSVQDIIAPLMGGQGYAANFHASVFNKEYLSTLLKKSGFRTVREWDPKTTPDHSFDDWAGRKIMVYGKEWRISLNIEAVK